MSSVGISLSPTHATSCQICCCACLDLFSPAMCRVPKHVCKSVQSICVEFCLRMCASCVRLCVCVCRGARTRSRSGLTLKTSCLSWRRSQASCSREATRTSTPLQSELACALNNTECRRCADTVRSLLSGALPGQAPSQLLSTFSASSFLLAR